MELIQNIDYRLQGYHKKKIYDSKGDVTFVEYYKDYALTAAQYSGLKVRETRTVYRDPVLGIPYQLDVYIEWFKGDGAEVIATKLIEKFINSFDGMAMNTASRTRLVEMAQGYLLGEVGLANTQEFGSDVALERSAYISGTRQSLINAINNSVRSYMTPTIKATLVSILDVQY